MVIDEKYDATALDCRTTTAAAAALKYTLCFECMGVKVGVRSDQRVPVERIKGLLPEILPVKWKEINSSGVKHWFSLVEGGTESGQFHLYKESERISEGKNLSETHAALESQVRLTIAEYAKSFVFLHAGAVTRRGKAIIIPGKSFSGKTTLVSELIKRGCGYLSDEYAVIDRRGTVHPFLKKLSVRGIIDDFRQVDLAVEDLGGVGRKTPAPVGFILLTQYEKGIKRKEIKPSSIGEGMMACVANSISVRRNPKFVMEVLGIVARSSVFIGGGRWEAGEYADCLLKYLDENHFPRRRLAAAPRSPGFETKKKQISPDDRTRE